MVSPKSNLVKALQHIIVHNNFQLETTIHGRNRINNMGQALEEFVKDSFANSFTHVGQERYESHSNVFSYLGNTNNPPDMMLHAGDAIEVKKIETATSAIALNSSYPKNVLHRDDSKLTRECCNLSDWSSDTRDILYVIGHVKNKKLRHIFYIYGDCYAASREVYQHVQHSIITGLESLSGDIELADTKELGRVNRVDPLGITLLRIRGMWHIDNPKKVFAYLNVPDNHKVFSFTCLLTKKKYLSFPQTDRQALLALGVQQTNINIPNPNNPSQLIEAVTLYYEATPEDTSEDTSEEHTSEDYGAA